MAATAQMDMFDGGVQPARAVRHEPQPALYPASPGFKREGTSREAAEGVASKAATIRLRVLAELRKGPATPEQVAKRLGEDLLGTRPRFSELSKAGKIEPTGERGKSQSGRTSMVWRVRA